MKIVERLEKILSEVEYIGPTKNGGVTIKLSREEVILLGKLIFSAREGNEASDEVVKFGMKLLDDMKNAL
jgi:hypothetical protein